MIDGVCLDIVFDIKPKSFAILSDNGSGFLKEFEDIIKEKGLMHYWTYPRSPKMNAYNERLIEPHRSSLLISMRIYFLLILNYSIKKWLLGLLITMLKYFHLFINENSCRILFREMSLASYIVD